MELPRDKETRLHSSNHPGESGFSREEWAIVAMIRARVTQGETIERISRTSRLPYTSLRLLAVRAGIRYKHKRPSEEQVKAAVAAVCNEGLTFRAAGSRFGISRTAIHRYVVKKRAKSIDSAGEVKFEDGSREFNPNKRTWNCPTHGRVTVWPCVACMALAAKRR